MCHQTVSLVARQLEEAGIATVILGSARDIVEHCGVPRFVFTDFPLGNPCGKPYDEEMQLAILRTGLQVLSEAQTGGSTVQTQWQWGSDEWRQNYMEVTAQNRERLRREGEARRSKIS